MKKLRFTKKGITLGVLVLGMTFAGTCLNGCGIKDSGVEPKDTKKTNLELEDETKAEGAGEESKVEEVGQEEAGQEKAEQEEAGKEEAGQEEAGAMESGNELPQLENTLPKEAAETVEGYVKPMQLQEKITFETPEGQETMVVKGELDEYETYYNIILETSQGSVTQETQAYSINPYFIQLAGGQQYVYLDCGTDNDYRFLVVFGYEKGKVRFIDEIPNTSPGSYPFLNPEKFTLESRMDLISTVGGTKRYAVGANGMPESLDEDYTINEPLILTSKRELLVTMIDPKTRAVLKEQVTLPPSTQFILKATDDATYADADLPDGRACRIMVEVTQDWPSRLVNGIDLEECFDGIIFAG